MGATAGRRDAATTRSRNATIVWSPDATTAIAPLRRFVSEPISGRILAPQPDVVDHRRRLRHWRDRPAGRHLSLYRTTGFAQRRHPLAHSEHLLGSPNSFGGHDTDACGG